MPADRLITVNVYAAGARNEHGIYEEGPLSQYRQWATRRDLTQEDIESEAGIRDSTRRDWRIRWDSRIARVKVVFLEVVDGGETFNVENMVEVTRGGRGRQDLRRRFLDIQGVYTT